MKIQSFPQLRLNKVKIFTEPFPETGSRWTQASPPVTGRSSAYNQQVDQRVYEGLIRVSAGPTGLKRTLTIKQVNCVLTELRKPQSPKTCFLFFYMLKPPKLTDSVSNRVVFLKSDSSVRNLWAGKPASTHLTQQNKSWCWNKLKYSLQKKLSTSSVQLRFINCINHESYYLKILVYLLHSGEFTPGDFYFDVTQVLFVCLCCLFLMTSLLFTSCWNDDVRGPCCLPCVSAFKIHFIDQLLICILINTEGNSRFFCGVYWFTNVKVQSHIFTWKLIYFQREVDILFWWVIFQHKFIVLWLWYETEP